MPSSETILAGLRLASLTSLSLAGLWHALVAACLGALFFGRRPPRRVAALLLSAPLVSASAVAFIFGNPFNGCLLGLTALVLSTIAAGFERAPVRLGSVAERIFGGGLIAFGCFYPHFLDARPAVTYLWGAPVGVIPCPTLSLVVGFALAFGGFGSRAWSLVLAAVGLFYGAFGVLRLGVSIDLVLIVGVIGLAARSLLGFSDVRVPSPSKG